MSVVTYTRDGVSDINTLICALVTDLTGAGAPITGSAAEHMKVVYPAGFDPTQPSALGNDTLVILESTTNIDPFARADVTVEDPTKDPWRIAFHASHWKDRTTATLGGGPPATWSTTPSNIDVASLAVYLGTPSNLYVDPVTGDATIGWVTTTTQKLPYYYNYPQAGTTLAFTDPWNFKSTANGDPIYKGRDLVEPVGNTGAQWTNSFDPNSVTNKMNPPPANPPSSNPPSVYTSPAPWDGPDVRDADQLFLNRWVVSGVKSASFGGFAADSSYAQPVSYRITLTDHGMFLGCWGPDPEENGKGFSWVLVQRPVDKKYGIIRGLPEDPNNPGNRPLFCVNSVNGKFWKFVVREHDNGVPSARKDATKNTPDSGQVINPYQQQSLTENGEYVITFLNNLNSSRFKYSDELDMLGTVSSDVVGGGSDIEVSVYNEDDKRKYHALWSSGSYGTKMRIMVVADIPTPNTP